MINKLTIKNIQRNKNKKLSDETKTKLRYANLGKKLSDETKKRISESNKGRSNYPSVRGCENDK